MVDLVRANAFFEIGLPPMADTLPLRSAPLPGQARWSAATEMRGLDYRNNLPIFIMAAVLRSGASGESDTVCASPVNGR